jgi:hypothetical protein
MLNKFTSVAALSVVASGVFAETNLELLKSVQSPSDILINVNNKEIPESPRVFKGLYDRERYGDWLLDFSSLDVERSAGSSYIPDSNIVHIYTTDVNNRGYNLIFSCSSGLISEGGQNYSVFAAIKAVIDSNVAINDFNQYYYAFDDKEGAMQESARGAGGMISLGATSSHVLNMISLFKNGNEFSGMLDVNSEKKVFQFSLKGFSKAYGEMKDRCLKFSYLTYNRVFR